MMIGVRRVVSTLVASTVLVSFSALAAPKVSLPQMCAASLAVTPHKEQGLICFRKSSTCLCSPADFTEKGWPMTPITPGEPGWNSHVINQRFLDDLHNRLLDSGDRERKNAIRGEIRDVSRALKEYRE